MILFSDPSCPYCQRVRIVLAEKSVTVEVHEVNAHNAPSALKEINPYGTVPTFVDRDLHIYESRIIMEYLDERFPHPPLLPVDPISRANTRLFMHRIDHDWYSLMNRIRKDNTRDAQRARVELQASLTASISIFAAHPFFMSEVFSIIDCYLAPLLWRLPVFGIQLPPHAEAIHAYMRRIFSYGSFCMSLTEAEKEMITDLVK